MPLKLPSGQPWPFSDVTWQVPCVAYLGPEIKFCDVMQGRLDRQAHGSRGTVPAWEGKPGRSAETRCLW